MKDVIETFTPEQGVTIDNAIGYIEAIESAVRSGITRLPKEERSLMLGVISGAMAQTCGTINRFRIDLEKKGLSTPVTEEQKMQLRLLIRQALAKRKAES